MRGNTLDRARFEAMLREYYELRGWDRDSGIPAESTMRSLGLGDVVAAL
jgi:aldehyde:ferredoxin oxidoreductase